MKLKPSASLLTSAILTFFLAVPLSAETCEQICRAYVDCVNQAYPGDSTSAQQETILKGCMTGCASNNQAANQCYENADGSAGKVASCEEFSACILQSSN